MLRRRGVPAGGVVLFDARNPRTSPLWQLLDRHFEEFERVYSNACGAATASGAP